MENNNEDMPANDQQKQQKGNKRPKADCSIRFIVIGEKAVGKTSLIQRYVNNKFSGQNLPTLGVDQSSKIIVINDKNIKLIINDTAGAEQFQSLTHNYYKNADIVLCVYDVSDRSSFQQVNKWVDSIEEKGRTDALKVMIGNKIDLAKQITTQEGQDQASKCGFEFIECSAFNGHNVDEVFRTAATKWVEDPKNKAFAQNDPSQLGTTPDGGNGNIRLTAQGQNINQSQIKSNSSVNQSARN